MKHRIEWHNKLYLAGFFIVGVVEIFLENWFSALGWIVGGLGWVAFEQEKCFYDELEDIVRKKLIPEKTEHEKT